ncbi:hypothetical protein Ais01nite_80730 [Asanoa ishikariensis]|uniref:Uncharacterized protein n=1 Tax=Asanoa ishikariensis TaxID=137265 RepID=A0A1H3UZF9_9ACTN|nr:hypothetical protein [Asanoa ishikariensis]GIF70038.1 hypothetical protein Ais01nite_80730 [Asanoa ishikariensis]SDZ67361.1 hypothetical protein SAMN05421684_8415 [Asanoa ishikariensis]
MLKRALGGVVAALAVTGGLAVVSAAPAAAATPASRCSTSTLTNTKGWTTKAGGTVKVVPNGAQVATPVQDSAVQYRYNLPTRVKLSDVSALSYELTKLDGTTVDGTPIPAGNAAALPAYRLFLDLTNNGSEDGAIVYEPYYQIDGNPARGQTTTWDVDQGKFWTGATIPGMVSEGGGSYANNRTLTEIRTANPNARVVAFAVGQGTYNDGTVARVNHVRFAGGRVCQEIVWKAPAAPSWQLSFSPARCGERSSTVTVRNTGRVNITVRFGNGRAQTVKPGKSVAERFRSGRLTVFVNGREAGEFRHQQVPCRADSRH